MTGDVGAGQSVTGSFVVGDVVLVRDVAGDVTITARRPPYRVDEFPTAVRALPVAAARAQPSRLLQPRHAVVPFVGRKDDLARLYRWLAGDAAISVRLIHATGGQGKTRLATHLATGCAATGWAVWRFHHSPAQTVTSQVGLPAGGEVVAVVDYADRWPMSHLLALLADLSGLSRRTGIVLRVLLLARSMGFWWPTLADRLDGELSVDAAANALSPLGEHIDPAELFDQARRHFAERLAVTGTETLALPRDQAGDNLVLAVHMAALVGVDAHLHGNPGPVGAHQVSAYLLRREFAQWKSLHGRAEDPIPTTETTMARAVYLATLTGALPRKQATAALVNTGLVSTVEGAHQLIDDHRACYPPAAPTTVLESLHPDRLGEDFLALRTPGHPHDDAAWLSDDWSLTATTRLLTPGPDGAAPSWTRPVLTVLVETACRWPHIATGVLYPLVRNNPALAIAAGGATLTRLAALDGIDATVLTPIEALLPNDRHIEFDLAAAAISTKLTALRLLTTNDPEQQALLYNKHAQRLALAGRHHEALIPAEQAIERCRRLAELNPTLHLPNLARALFNLGQRLTNVGRDHDALAAAEEAVVIRRRLAKADPGAHLPELAASLASLGSHLLDVGQHSEALAAGEEGLAIQRRLIETDSAAHLLELASSLTGIGRLRSALGRHAEAYAATEEAVAIHRRLVESDPAAHLPSLALSLSNAAGVLSMLGRHEEALAPAEEAVAIRRRLVDANPAAHLRDLAMSLSNFAAFLFQLGRNEEALAPSEEATLLCRQLAQVNPGAYLPNLGMALINLASLLWRVGRHDAALVPAEEATHLFQLLAQVNPAHLPNLAATLSNLALYLGQLGRHNDSLAPAEEAVAIWRRLAEVAPEVYRSKLVESLTTLGERLSGLGENDKALAQAEEALAIRRRLAEADPTHLPDLATSLSKLGNDLSKLGRADQAVAAAEEAVLIHQQLATADPSAHLLDRAKSLWVYAAVCVKCNLRLPDALTAAQTAVDLFATLVVDNGSERHASLAVGAMKTQADVLDRLGRTDEANKLRAPVHIFIKKQSRG